MRITKVTRARPRNLAGRQERFIGWFAIPTAAEPQRPSVGLNRYPGKVIGVAFCPGGRRYLSWVWPVVVHFRPKHLPWPDVQECYGWDPNSRTAMELHPDPLCPQCDDQHEHRWVPGPRHLSYGHGVPVRCKVCGARKCDAPKCTERRHHETPHTHEMAGAA